MKYFFIRKGKRKESLPFAEWKICYILLLDQKSQKMAQITVEQRYIIEVLKKQGFSNKSIAKAIDKHPSAVGRELKRNSDFRSHEYRAQLAHKKCESRHESKPKKVRFTSEIQYFVEYYIKQDYSPEQIVGMAKIKHRKWVSSERIYQYIWEDKKKGGTLYKHLRSRGKRYRKRGASKDKRGQIIGRIGIEKRPKIVEEKSRFGDLEMDLVVGKNHDGAILTVNDRATGQTKIALLQSKSAQEVKEKAIEILKKWKGLMHTITSDNGKEFALHQEIASELGIHFYFAKPYSPWERGANENYNGLLRQYFPKGYDFNLITQNNIEYVENKLNNRPRKRFGFLSPNQVFLQTINNNGQIAFMT